MHAKGDYIVWELHCIFRVRRPLDFVIREFGEGKHAECGIGFSDVYQRTMNEGHTPKCGSMRKRLTDIKLMKIEKSMPNPIVINLNLSGHDSDTLAGSAQIITIQDLCALM